MFKATIDSPSHEKVFIRQALFESLVRFDGRGIDDCRDVSIELTRNETSSTSEVQLGDTLVVCIVSGVIVTPYPDRPSDGILQFQASVSTLAENTGFLHTDLSRLLERAIRESESIDTESLCIISGEKVWMINCEVRVVDCTGGNIIDACMLAAMAALKAFRKPETSVVSSEAALEISGDEDVEIESGIIVHHSDEREPLPLALHHTPLSVTLGVFKNTLTTLSSGSSSGAAAEEQRERPPLMMIVDPTLQEEAAMDGKLVFSINAHRELCAMSKPGGIALPTSAILKAAQAAARRAAQLHVRLDAALAELEVVVLADREKRQLVLQKLHELSQAKNAAEQPPAAVASFSTMGGIDRNDPILAWSSLHQAAGLWNE